MRSRDRDEDREEATNRLLGVLTEGIQQLVASLTDINASLDSLTATVGTLATQEQGEVAISQADLDTLNQKVLDLTAQVQALVDAKTPA
jgi:hypothetical protein